MGLKRTISVIIGSLLLSTLLYPNDVPEVKTQGTAALLWRYTTGGRIITPPVEDSDGTLYFCSEDRFLYALNNDGTLKWRLYLKDRITNTLTLGYDGTIYVGSKKGFLISVNPMGEQLWKIKLKGEPFGTPAVEPNGSIFSLTDNGWFYSISHTGFIRWEIKLPSAPVISPVVGRNIYIALSNDRIYSYNRSGTKIWTFLLSGQADSIALSTDKIYVGTSNSTLVSIDYTGKRVWNVYFQGKVSSIIVLTDDRIICAMGNNIVMLDSFGDSKWVKSGQRMALDISAISNEIISIDVEGHITWFDINGQKIAQLKGGNPIQRVLLASDGAIYLGSKDWLFYKYGLKNIVISDYINYIWPSFRGGPENRGFLGSVEEEQREMGNLVLSDYVYLNELARSNDQKILGNLLDEIENRLYIRDYDPGKSYLIDILEILASDCVKRPLYEDGLLINNFPVIRSKAIDILGITGNFETIEFLTDLLDYEWDTYVINSNIRSLGLLQSDNDGLLTNALVSYYNKHREDIEERSLSQILIAVRKMNQYSGTSNIDLLGMITDIFIKSSSKSVKELALDTINSIKK